MEGKKEKKIHLVWKVAPAWHERGENSLFLFLFVSSVIFHDYFLHYNVICGTVY